MEQYNPTMERTNGTPEQMKVAKIFAQAAAALEKVDSSKEMINLVDFVDFKTALQRAIRACEESRDPSLKSFGVSLVEFRNRMFVTKEFTKFSELKDAYETILSESDIKDLIQPIAA